MKKSYYEILGVAEDAEPAEIKKAYRERSKELHPDRGGDEEQFKELNEAYSVLSDPDKREFYDLHGAEPEKQQHFDQALAEIISAALDDTRPGSTVETFVKRRVADSRNGLERKEKSLVKKKQKLERKIDRIICKAKRDPVSELLQAKISSINLNLESIEGARETLDYIEKRIKEDYEFKPAPPTEDYHSPFMSFDEVDKFASAKSSMFSDEMLERVMRGE